MVDTRKKSKLEGDKTSNTFYVKYGKKRIEHPYVGGVSIRGKNGDPSRKGCM